MKKHLYWVFADLCAEKDTIKILSDLNKAYPFPDSDAARAEHEALGKLNLEIIDRAVKYMAEGDAESLGKLMNEAEAIFNEKVVPMSSALQSPKLNAVLADPKIQPLVWGGKGVGSHGDGSVQFLARSEEAQKQLEDYLNNQGMKAYSLTIKPVHTVRKAIIPVAGFGTRLYPATRALKKDFLMAWSALLFSSCLRNSSRVASRKFVWCLALRKSVRCMQTSLSVLSQMNICAS